MTAICKMTGKEIELPCSASGCPLFGDCIVEFQKERRKSKSKQTNADRIRAMSDEELAKVIICPKQVCDKLHILVGRTDCEACSLEWLKQPADMRGEEDG